MSTGSSSFSHWHPKGSNWHSSSSLRGKVLDPAPIGLAHSTHSLTSVPFEVREVCSFKCPPSQTHTSNPWQKATLSYRAHNTQSQQPKKCALWSGHRLTIKHQMRVFGDEVSPKKCQSSQTHSSNPWHMPHITVTWDMCPVEDVAHHPVLIPRILPKLMPLKTLVISRVISANYSMFILRQVAFGLYFTLWLSVSCIVKWWYIAVSTMNLNIR